MATTKQLLERMVQKVCGLADCVSGNPVTIPAPTSTYQEYVPTKDGYIFLHTTPSADGYYYALRPNTSTAYACIFTSMTLGAGTFSSNTFRVWKGKVCRYKQTDPNPSLSEAIFFESIGGGGYRLFLKTLKRGRLLCLRLSRYLTLQLKQGVSSLCQIKAQHQSKRLSQVAQGVTQPLPMVGLWFVRLSQKNSTFLSANFSSIPLLLALKGILRSRFRCVKDSQSQLFGVQTTMGTTVERYSFPAVSANCEGGYYGFA